MGLLRAIKFKRIDKQPACDHIFRPISYIFQDFRLACVCRWPWLFVFANKQLIMLDTSAVRIETTTPDLVCAEQLIAPKVTGVDIKATCTQVINGGFTAAKTDDRMAFGGAQQPEPIWSSNATAQFVLLRRPFVLPKGYDSQHAVLHISAQPIPNRLVGPRHGGSLASKLLCAYKLWVSFQWKNPDFLMRNPVFLLKILIL